MELTPDPETQATRALDAAQAKLQAGLAEAAARLLAVAESGSLGDMDRARSALLQGQLAFVSSHGHDAPRLLVAAASRFEALDPALARDTYLDALAASLFVGRFEGDVSIRDVAAAARTAQLPSETRPICSLVG